MLRFGESQLNPFLTKADEFMCGICGYVTRNHFEGNVIESMTNQLAHRGPDDSGTIVRDYEGYQIALGHRRLSILDTSDRGRQPMSDEAESVFLTFNGEIYNFQDLAVTLRDAGYTFRSAGDTEVLLYAFREWGIGSMEYLNGMFSFAVWNPVTAILYLVRDRLGIKPLYYSLHDGCLIFGSELRAVTAYPSFPREINNEILTSYLINGYIPSPHTVFRKTFKLPAGHYCEYHARSGDYNIRPYWKVETIYQPDDFDESLLESGQDDLERLLANAVRQHLVSDVPVGAFLSGGIDSSLVAALMQKESARPIRTFTIGFENPDYNEANHARAVSEHLGTEHYEQIFTANELFDLVKRIPDVYDEPFADASQLPTILLSSFARKFVTVCLSGDGGDEQFCGYKMYKNDMIYERLTRVSKIARKLFGDGQSFYPRMLMKLISLDSGDRILAQNYHKLVVYIEQLFQLKSGGDFGLAYRYRNDLDLRENHMMMDLKYYLVDDILTKVDRASMAFGLEVRVPLLDHRVVEMSSRMPLEFKVRGGISKFLLRQILYQYVPQDLVDRPKKGFSVPLADWLNNELRDDIDNYCTRTYLDNQGIFDYDEISRLRRRVKENDSWFISIFWHFYVFQLWYDRYIAT